jgi:hypothetical protein
MHLALSLVAACAATMVYADEPGSSSPPPRRMELTTAAGVVDPTPTSLGVPKMLPCQAMAGDSVWLLQTVPLVQGVAGATAAYVKFIDGACAGQVGFVNPTLLKDAAPR